VSRRVWIVTLAGAIWCATAACEGERKALVPLAASHRFEVPADRPFTETGFVLAPDVDYRFRHVSGGICTQGRERCAPPRGSDLPGEEAWALHLKLGDQLVPFRDEMVLSVDTQTELVFYLPEGDSEDYDEDKLPLYADNRGSFGIEVLENEIPPQAGLGSGVVLRAATADAWCGAGVGEQVKALAALGADSVLLPVPYLTDGVTLWPGTRTPRALCLVRATHAAREHGLSVGWSLELERADRGPLAELEPPDRVAFLAGYGEMARLYAGLAASEEVELLSAGKGLVSLTRTPEDRRDLLRLFLGLHTRYYGLLTYTARHEELAVLEPSFWTTCCDRVGVVPGWSLSDATLPASAPLVVAWAPYVEALRRTFEATGLRLALVDAPAYPATTACAWRPLDTVDGRIPDELCQREAYRAWFQVFGEDAAAFVSDAFLGEVIVGGPASPLSPLGRLAEEIVRDAWTK